MQHGRRVLAGAAVLTAALVSLPASSPDQAASAVADVSMTRGPVGRGLLSAEARPSVGSAIRERPPIGTPPAAAVAEPPTVPVEQALPVAFGGQGIPEQVRAAYERAAGLLATSDPDCGLTWELLAGVGRIESGHASDGRLDEAGTTRGRILGPRLDGTLTGAATIADSDGGVLDGDGEFDRALGPMQFLPGTWLTYGADGNEDGIRDPHNIDDAASAAARYLCAAGGNLTRPADLTAALYRYNRSVGYGLTVQAWAQAYRTGGAPVIPAQDGAVPQPSATPEPSSAPMPPLASEPSPDVGTMLAEPEGAVRPGVESGEEGPEADPTPGPDGRLAAEAPTADGPPASDGEGVAEDGDVPDGTAPAPSSEPSTGSVPDCASEVLAASVMVVLPDSGGLLLRFPLDDLPEDCSIVSANLVLDPGPDVENRAIRVELVDDAWSEDTTEAPRTAGDPVVADAGTGERMWSIDALFAALIEGPDHGVLLSMEADDSPASPSPDGEARMEILLGPAEPG